MMQDKTRVIVVKGGVPKELHNLEDEVIIKLEEAYLNEPVVGISEELFQQMTELLSLRMAEFRKILKEDEKCEGMFSRSIAFAKAMEITSTETPALFDCILWVDRCIQEQENFNSRRVNMRALKEWTHMTHNELYREFKTWVRDYFKANGIRGVGIVKFLKFFEVAAVSIA